MLMKFPISPNSKHTQCYTVLVQNDSFCLQLMENCLGFSCRRQQKGHAAAPPPAGVRRRMKRKRQKLVGRDKGSLTEQQTKGNSNNNDTDKEKTQQRTTRPHRPSLPDRTHAAPSRAASEFPPRRAPPPTGTQRDSTWYGIPGFVWPGWGWVSPPGCAPSWILVKINPVLAKPRTILFFCIFRELTPSLRAILHTQISAELSQYLHSPHSELEYAPSRLPRSMCGCVICIYISGGSRVKIQAIIGSCFLSSVASYAGTVHDTLFVDIFTINS